MCIINYSLLYVYINVYLKFFQEKVSSPSSPSGNVAGGGGGGDCDNEQYEKGIPAHGDLTFHNFLSVIQQNPGQIIRFLLLN